MRGGGHEITHDPPPTPQPLSFITMMDVKYLKTALWSWRCAFHGAAVLPLLEAAIRRVHYPIPAGVLAESGGGLAQDNNWAQQRIQSGWRRLGLPFPGRRARRLPDFAGSVTILPSSLFFPLSSSKVRVRGMICSFLSVFSLWICTVVWRLLSQWCLFVIITYFYYSIFESLMFADCFLFGLWSSFLAFPPYTAGPPSPQL